MTDPSEPTSHITIKKLPPILIDQIAAGEVVERPANVIKELVENSLDADASQVHVELSNGGMDSIAVLDDGIGMSKEDLELCIGRHTTSKISRADDLEAIGSYGFRGEALSSIAAVSEFEIQSRTAEMNHANGIRISFGNNLGVTPQAGPVGTRITVRSIFERLPARKKFLRSSGTEFSHCSKLMRELALAHPGVRFGLSHQGRRIFEFTPQTRQERIQTVLKPKWKPVCISEETEGIHMEAYLSPPSWIQDRGDLFFFINQRPIKNRALYSLVRSAYLDSLGPHHYPSGVLYIDMLAEWVDVNVHPQKWEVRLWKQERLLPWIRSQIKKALSANSFTQIAPVENFQAKEEWVLPMESFPERPANPPILNVESPTLEPYSPPPTSVSPPKQGSARYLGQLRSGYLVGEDERGLLIVDSRAVEEKNTFDQLLESVRDNGIPTHEASPALVIQLKSVDSTQLVHKKAFLKQLGFDYEDFGNGDVSILHYPQILLRNDVENVFGELVIALNEDLESALKVLAQQIRMQPQKDVQQTLDELAGCSESPLGLNGKPLVFRVPNQTVGSFFER